MDAAGSRRWIKRPMAVVAAVAVLAVLCGAAALAVVGNGGEPGSPLAGDPTSAQDGIETLGPHAAIVRPAAVIDVVAQPLVDVRAFPGTVHPARSSRLAFRVSGPLVDLAVREGDVVVAGTLLAQIDPRDFELAVLELRARLDAAEAAQLLAQINHRRREQLVARGAVSPAELDQATAERDRTAAEVAALTQALAQAEAALDDTRLVAPFDGRVAGLHIELHDYVNAREPAIMFHDTSGTDLVVDLPERIMPRIPDIQGIEVEISDMRGRRHPATIREIASEQAADTGTYRTAVRLSDLGDVAPLAGLSGIAYVTFADGSGAPDEVLVPSSAVFAGDDGDDFVWVVDGDPPTVTARRVTTTGVVGDQARLAGGLADGERIIAYGADFLAEGQQVRPFSPPFWVAGGAP